MVDIVYIILCSVRLSSMCSLLESTRKIVLWDTQQSLSKGLRGSIETLLGPRTSKENLQN